MKITAWCHVCGAVYTSSKIKGLRHGDNAERKAVRLGEAHILGEYRAARAAEPHAVDVSREWPDRPSGEEQRTPVAVLRMRCVRCGGATPGLVGGRCEGCVFEGFPPLAGDEDARA